MRDAHMMGNRRKAVRWLSALGLVAALATVPLFVLSLNYFGSYRAPRWGFGVGKGQLTVWINRRVDRLGPGMTWQWGKYRVGGVFWLPKAVLNPNVVAVSIPFWLPFVVLFPVSLFGWRRTWPYPPGHCSRCGYDMTGNESGVCPECGTKIEHTTQEPLGR